jgi:hypothetical protein
MNLKDKIVGLALASLIALIGWNLNETWGLKEAVIQLQHGQIILSKQIKKNSAFVKQKLKNKVRNKNNIRYLIIHQFPASFSYSYSFYYFSLLLYQYSFYSVFSLFV